MIEAAIELVEAAADGAGDDEITPSEIAGQIRDALELDELAEHPPLVRQYLVESLDSVSDGMPAEHVAMALYAALGVMSRL